MYPSLRDLLDPSLKDLWILYWYFTKRPFESFTKRTLDYSLRDLLDPSQRVILDPSLKDLLDPLLRNLSDPSPKTLLDTLLRDLLDFSLRTVLEFLNPWVRNPLDLWLRKWLQNDSKQQKILLFWLVMKVSFLEICFNVSLFWVTNDLYFASTNVHFLIHNNT